jgi:hypothetical protein
MAKRWKFAPDFSAQVVLEELTGLNDKTEIRREYRLSRQLFSRCQAELVERAPEIFATERSRGDEQERTAELERVTGRLTMELEAAKEPRMSCQFSSVIGPLILLRWATRRGDAAHETPVDG